MLTNRPRRRTQIHFSFPLPPKTQELFFFLSLLLTGSGLSFFPLVRNLDTSLPFFELHMDKPAMVAFNALVVAAVKPAVDEHALDPYYETGYASSPPHKRALLAFVHAHTWAFYMLGDLQCSLLVRHAGIGFVLNSFDLRVGAVFTLLLSLPGFAVWHKNRLATLQAKLQDKKHIIYASGFNIANCALFSANEKAMTQVYARVLNATLPNRPTTDLSTWLNAKQLPQELQEVVPPKAGLKPTGGSAEAAPTAVSSSSSSSSSSSAAAASSSSSAWTSADEEGEAVKNLLFGVIGRLEYPWFDTVMAYDEVKEILEDDTPKGVLSFMYVALAPSYEVVQAMELEPDLLTTLSEGASTVGVRKYEEAGAALKASLDVIFAKKNKEDVTFTLNSFGENLEGCKSIGLEILKDTVDVAEKRRIRYEIMRTYHCLSCMFGPFADFCKPGDPRLEYIFNEAMCTADGRTVTEVHYKCIVEVTFGFGSVNLADLSQSSSLSASSVQLGVDGRFGLGPLCFKGINVTNARSMVGAPNLHANFEAKVPVTQRTSKLYKDLFDRCRANWNLMEGLEPAESVEKVRVFPEHKYVYVPPQATKGKAAPKAAAKPPSKKQRQEDDDEMELAELEAARLHFKEMGPKYNERLHEFRVYAEGSKVHDKAWSSKTWGHPQYVDEVNIGGLNGGSDDDDIEEIDEEEDT